MLVDDVLNDGGKPPFHIVRPCSVVFVDENSVVAYVERRVNFVL